MSCVRWAPPVLSTLIVLIPFSASADDIGEVAGAQANARAGGPVSAYDRDLLARWGCESGTQSVYCQQIRHGANRGDYPYRRWSR